MNIRRLLLSFPKVVAAPGVQNLSHGVQNHRIWKLVVAAPFSSGDGASASAEKAKVASRSRQMEKKMIYQKLKSLTVETIDLIIKEEEKKGVSVTQADLVSWAKRLTYKDVGKPENALEIFRWMDKEKMIFSPKELALYVDLIAKVEGSQAAVAYFKKVDPDFDSTDPDAKNWPAFMVTEDWILKGWEESPLKRSGFRIPLSSGFRIPLSSLAFGKK